MKLSDLEPGKTIKPLTRTYLLGAVAIAIPLWDASFNLGAFNEIFFDKIFLAWTTTAATLLALIFLPKHKSPVKLPGIIILSLPTILMILLAIQLNLSSQEALLYDSAFLLSVLVFVISLPYTIYTITYITNPELIKLRGRRIKLSLIVIAVIIGTAGFLVGKYNYYFLTCYDFKVSGNDLPVNCNPARR